MFVSVNVICNINCILLTESFYWTVSQQKGKARVKNIIQEQNLGLDVHIL